MAKKLILAAVILGAAFLAWRFFGAGTGEQPQGQGGVPVSVAAVLRREVIEWDEFSGRLVAVDRVEIRPRVAGTIEQVHFEEGQMVQKGEMLFTIDPRPFEAELARAQAAVAAAQAQAKFAKEDFERASSLIKAKAIPQKEYDARRNDNVSAIANLNVTQAALKLAQLNLEYTKILAPVSGKVGRAEITQGNLVEAGGNAPVLTTIVSVDPIYADFDADEQSFLKYLQAHGSNPENLRRIPVTMTLTGDQGGERQGAIRSFDNELSARGGTVRVRAVFDNQDGALIPGLYARIRLGGSGRHPALLVHERAIGTDQSKKFVYVVDAQNKVSYREVKLGPITEGLRVVREGLEEGERIVVVGLQRVRPGAEVAPQEVSMETLKAPGETQAKESELPPEAVEPQAVTRQEPAQ